MEQPDCLTRSTAMKILVLKTGSHHRRVQAPKDGDVDCGPVFSSDLGLQAQWQVHSAVGVDDPTGVGAAKQHSRRVLTHLGRQARGISKPCTMRNKEHNDLF